VTEVPRRSDIRILALRLSVRGQSSLQTRFMLLQGSGVPRNFVRWGEGEGRSTNSVEDREHRERGSGGCNPLVRGSGGSCNLVQEISFHVVKFS